MSISIIGLDADDTLWHNETIFRLTHERFRDLLADFAAPEAIEAHLAAVEQRNLRLYGYGVKGFTLSMLETAVELSARAVPAEVMAEILAAGREMMQHPVEPLPGVDDALEVLAEPLPAGADHQGRSVPSGTEAGGLGAGRVLFAAVEIVSEKEPDTYARVFGRTAASVDSAVMAGNSVRSDVLPALEAGSWAALHPLSAGLGA